MTNSQKKAAKKTAIVAVGALVVGVVISQLPQVQMLISKFKMK